MTYDELEAVVRGQHARPITDEPLALGAKVAWMTRAHGKANDLSALHRHYEGGRTFCRLDIPSSAEQLPPLPSLHVCTRCEKMAGRALHYARLAGGIGPALKASA